MEHDRNCPFARIAAELYAHAQKLDPACPLTSLTELAVRLAAPATAHELDALFASLDLTPFGTARSA
jgi:hypothetical protein